MRYQTQRGSSPRMQEWPLGLPWFMILQCRRFVATRDGLGALPVDDVARDLGEVTRGEDGFRLFGLIHELVRRIADCPAFQWYPANCRLPSPDEARLMMACLAAIEDEPDLLARLCGDLAGDPVEAARLEGLIATLAATCTAGAHATVPVRKAG